MYLNEEIDKEVDKEVDKEISSESKNLSSMAVAVVIRDLVNSPESLKKIYKQAAAAISFTGLARVEPSIKPMDLVHDLITKMLDKRDNTRNFPKGADVMKYFERNLISIATNLRNKEKNRSELRGFKKESSFKDRKIRNTGGLSKRQMESFLYKGHLSKTIGGTRTLPSITGKSSGEQQLMCCGPHQNVESEISLKETIGKVLSLFEDDETSLCLLIGIALGHEGKDLSEFVGLEVNDKQLLDTKKKHMRRQLKKHFPNGW